MLGARPARPHLSAQREKSLFKKKRARSARSAEGTSALPAGSSLSPPTLAIKTRFDGNEKSQMENEGIRRASLGRPAQGWGSATRRSYSRSLHLHNVASCLFS